MLLLMDNKKKCMNSKNILYNIKIMQSSYEKILKEKKTLVKHFEATSNPYFFIPEKKKKSCFSKAKWKTQTT